MNNYKVGIIGNGNWGTTISKIIGENVKESKKFNNKVLLGMMDEMINNEKLSEIINNRHENPKYLPNIKLPDNIIAIPNMKEVAKECTHLIFVVPHQYLCNVLDDICNDVRKDTIAISLIKGLMEDENDVVLPSEIIKKKLNIHVSVLSGANIANEIAAEKLSTTTIGCSKIEYQDDWKMLFSRPYFKVDFIPFTIPMEIFGAVKNCIAVGLGFCEALGLGNNGKSTAIRIGFVEIIRFIQLFQPNCEIEMFLQSFGLDDLITTCSAGRNLKAAEAFVKSNKTILEIEQELLNGQKLQGPSTSNIVYKVLKNKNLTHKFPFLTYIYNVLNHHTSPNSLYDVILSC